MESLCIVQEILLQDEDLPQVVNVVEFGEAGVLRVRFASVIFTVDVRASGN